MDELLRNQITPQSCTGNHFSAAAATFLHQRLPFCTSSYQSWTSDHLPAPAATSPEPATTFLHQQLPVLKQRPPSCTSSYQSWTSDHQSWLPDLYQQLPVLHQRSPSYSRSYQSYNSRYQSCISDHQSNDYQSCTSYPVLHQLSSPAPATRSCTSDTFQQRRLSTICYSNYDSP